jgi:glucose-1-phosphate cytidylyltransferase
MIAGEPVRFNVGDGLVTKVVSSVNQMLSAILSRSDCHDGFADGGIPEARRVSNGPMLPLQARLPVTPIIWHIASILVLPLGFDQERPVIESPVLHGQEARPNMRVVILAGGSGTRLAEETVLRPKPMVEIGGKPMLWHIMSIYARQGYKDFLVACGYKGEVIKEYFRNYHLHNSDLFLNLKDGSVRAANSSTPDWQVGLIDTGLNTLTGGRLRRMKGLIGNAPFMVTYGDGVADVDIQALVAFHRSHGKVATITAVLPVARFGSLQLSGDTVVRFAEKPRSSDGWINGGFFVFQPEVLDYISGDNIPLEGEPLERLASEGQLLAYRHPGFWHPMDTLRDKQLLESLWATGNPPWITK